MPKRFVLRTGKAARLRQQALLQFARSAALQPDRRRHPIVRGPNPAPSRVLVNESIELRLQPRRSRSARADGTGAKWPAPPSRPSPPIAVQRSLPL